MSHPRSIAIAVVFASLAVDGCAREERAVSGAQALDGWTEALTSALAPAKRLRVRSGGTCHRDEAQEQTLYETNDPAEIKQLLAGIQINEAQSGFHCMCCGNPSLEFYAGERLLLTLGFHHGRGLRWRDGWPGDAMLTPQSSTFLVGWLAKRNVKSPLIEQEAAAERARATQHKMVQATAGMPAALAEAFAAGPDKFKAALVRALPDKKDRARIWLAVFGTSNDSWTMLEPLEQMSDQQLRTYDDAILAAAVEAALLGDDRQVRRGAARLWMSYRSPLEAWNPPNVAELRRIVLQVQQEARYYPLRMSALDKLAAWSQMVSAEELNRRLAAGLHDPAPPVRRKAMLIAGRIRHATSIAALMGVLQGNTLDVEPLPDVPLWEQSDVRPGFGDVAKGCSDAEVAALALAHMQHAEAKPVIEQIRPQTALVEVSLALLGHGDKLKPEHFDTKENNQELQLAAVEAVVRSKGRYGLKFALGYRQATHWWENEAVAVRLSQMLRAESAPDSQQLANCKSLDVLQEWFTKHGADYLQRFE